ncbi:MAG: sensor histidine kinase [Bacteroidetes bacterium]|nr:sensor histidine kinase [Bacteroidota bacterium]
MKLTGILVHIISWLLFLSLPLLFISGQADREDLVSIILHPYFWVFFLFYLLIFYLHTYILLPELYLKKRYILYVLTVIIFLIATIQLRPFDRLLGTVQKRIGIEQQQGPPRPEMRPAFPLQPPNGNKPPMPHTGNRGHIDIISFFLFFMVMSFSVALQYRQRLAVTEKRAMQAEADKANAELSFLKAQINPHFLFNTLNNIYSLAVMKDDKTAESVMKLSNIMRYVTDEVGEDFVPLEEEIECLKDFTDLQRLRLSKKTTVDLSIAGIVEGKRIPPLVLMSFVENAFKYGISNHEEAIITIRVETDAAGISFYCRNNNYDNREPVNRKGVGISNTQKRLSFLYPSKHSLLITSDDQFFTVELRLED